MATRPARRVVAALAVLVSTVVIASLMVGPTASATPASGGATRWVCNPAMASDPCDVPLDTTDLGTQKTTTPPVVAEADKPVDCFYVYPTVSNQIAFNADRVASPEVKSIAEYQAGRFSSQCRVFAPVYRQVPLAGLYAQLYGPNFTAPAYADVLVAWRDYLAHDNNGRGVILIGHSQGSLVLRRLIRDEIDSSPAVRSRLVGAFLMGGNVATATGKTTGGDFRNVPVCTARGQAGCVVAYSTTESDPVISLFGNSTHDVLSNQFGLPSKPGTEVACTDPAVLSGDDRPAGLTVPSKPFAPGIVAAMLAYTAFPSRPPTSRSTWTTSAERATGRCIDRNGYQFYQFRITNPRAQKVNEIPLFNAHLVDVNLGYDRLVSIADQMTTTWLASQNSRR